MKTLSTCVASSREAGDAGPEAAWLSSLEESTVLRLSFAGTEEGVATSSSLPSVAEGATKNRLHDR